MPARACSIVVVVVVVGLVTALGAPRASGQQAQPASTQTPEARPAPSLESRMQSAIERREQYRASRKAVYMDDFGQLARYRRANAELKPPPAGDARVVFMGDSITDMWRLPEYFPGKPYVNRGIGGQTTPQILIRFRQDVVDLAPKVVVILAGTNDIAGNSGPMSVEEIEANFQTMVELCKLHGIRVVLSSIIPVHNYTPASDPMFLLRPPETINVLNRWLQKYAAATGAVYLDYFSALVDAKGWLRRDLAEDGLHPNKAGYTIMAPLAEAAIKKALAQP
jgi:lysophospholipase L1-like esterase